MRYDDEYDDDDFPRRQRPQGVSSGWRIAAIVCGVLTGLFALMLLATTVALLDRPRQPPQPPPQVFLPPPPQNPPPFAAAPNNNDDDPDKGDPRKLPYPLVQDLRPPGVPLAAPGEPAAKPEPAPRSQFLRTGDISWANDEPNPPEAVVLSEDGERIAYAGSQGVMVGPLLTPRLVPGTEPSGTAPRGGFPGRIPTAAEQTGRVAWSSLGAVYWTAPDGRVGVLPPNGGAIRPIEGARASWAVPVPPTDKQIVLIREQARPKVEAPGRFSPADPSEVVVFDPAKKATRILIPLGTAVWRSPAVSPDGKRLALISNSGHEGELPLLWRVFLIDLTGGEPKPLTPAAPHCGSVAWVPDGKTLVYDRSAFLNEESFPGDGYRGNIFEADPSTGRETALTVGGDFSSPSVSRNDFLYCLAHSQQGNRKRVELLRVRRGTARDFVAKHRRPGRRSAKAWTALAGAALQEAELPADVRASALDGGKVRKLAAAFARNYPKHFPGEVPDTAAELDRLRSEARGLGLPPTERRKIALVLGAVEGEYLRRKHGAHWALDKQAGPALTDPKGHELFRYILNPFRDFLAEDLDEDEEPAFGTLTTALSLAEGRPLVLAHDLAVRTQVSATDPDLARGVALLKEGQGDEADRVLLEMTKRHAGNYYLALYVGALLSEQGRAAALRTLVGRLDAGALKDARVYNLVGVSQLDDNPKAAVTAFRNALRCNLYHGPAYFNLAQAYVKLNEVESARLCLRRFLKLLAYSPLADDARRRLAELNEPAMR